MTKYLAYYFSYDYNPMRVSKHLKCSSILLLQLAIWKRLWILEATNCLKKREITSLGHTSTLKARKKKTLIAVTWEQREGSK